MNQLITLLYALLFAVMLWAAAEFAAAEPVPASHTSNGPRLFVGDERVYPSCESLAYGIEFLERVIFDAQVAGVAYNCGAADGECYAMAATFFQAEELKKYLERYRDYHCVEA